MSKVMNTVTDIYQEIYDTKKIIEYKTNEYDELLETNKLLNINSENIKTKIYDINININSLNNLLDYYSDDNNNFTTLSIKNEYIESLKLLNSELLEIQNNINNIENQIYKLNIQFNAYDTYINNLYKMIPRINRWGNINNMTQYELDIEAFRNNYNFELQLSLINDPPPKLVRQ